MKKLTLKKNKVDVGSLNDVHRIVEFMASKGYVINELDARHAWSTYSDDHWCASWMGVGESTLNEFYQLLDRYFDEEEIE